ncbi:MAG TPA: leucyl/phenylalanyl-tRNA--protein transferase [Kofleriaceae bacterium]|jgi:leucyl/phenylalanyl-tRNA--protein transferase|nr:leucyl/phenylalanyl-tRNA--protein transferase [Kofleriaceae bacterium]
MPVFRLDERLVFPPVHLAEDGLLALGGDLRPERLLLGYTQGIFPWYAENLPILWHSPDPRMVMTTRDLVIQRSLRKSIKRKPYRLTMDAAFPDVLLGCAEAPRPGQTGTWLIPEMVDAYGRLFELGFAHSIEAWEGSKLVGGLYGVSLGAAFFGESMFAKAPDASKIAFAACVRQLDDWRIGLIDCQVHTEHLERFGAYEVPRLRYIELLTQALDEPTRRGRWAFELDLDAFAASGGATSPD